MKQLVLGQYQITLYPSGARFWYSINWGSLVLKRGHECSSHKATIKALDKLKEILI
jgi:hypothetical protein